MKNLIKGILLATIGLSLINGVSAFIETFFEWARGLFALKITRLNKNITDLTEPQEESHTRAIGFIAQEEEDDEYYD